MLNKSPCNFIDTEIQLGYNGGYKGLVLILLDTLDMTTLAINSLHSKLRFDIVEYIKKLRNAGVSQEIAEIQAQELEHVLEVAVSTFKEDMNSGELATKKDLDKTRLELQKEIADLRYTTLKFVVYTGCAVSVVVISSMYTMLKLMLH